MPITTAPVRIVQMTVVSFLAVLLSFCSSKDGSYMATNPSTDGYVPNEETAKKIAMAVWLPVYGKEIYDEEPFTAKLVNDSIWIVEGTLEKGMDGGTAYVEINKRDGKMLKLTHYK